MIPDYKALAKRLSDALLMVAPLGGSECFTRVGDDYYADPEWFARRIVENQERLHNAMTRAILAERQLSANGQSAGDRT